MSLLEDVVYILKMVMEYFGVQPDMLIPVWDSQLCGQYRSIVRMIGTNLSLTPVPRVHFQIPLTTHRPHGYVDVTVETPAIPSFADVMWVFEDEGESFAKTRNHLPPEKLSAVNRDVVRRPAAVNKVNQRGGRSVTPAANPDALKKILALENELLKLRAQIAMIVTAAPGSESQSSPLTPLVPALTSTPRCAPPPPPPPPPLPPPPPCPDSSSVIKLIQQRRKKDSDQAEVRQQENKQIPSMLDVLKDLNQVKLRSVERSPGGTPLQRRRSKGGSALLSDPAALIAEALKRKFAQNRHNNSSDKENSVELSPFGSPETPKVHHSRRSQGRRRL